MLSKNLLEILRCPRCHGELSYDPARERLACRECRESFSVAHDIPIMLPNDERTNT